MGTVLTKRIGVISARPESRAELILFRIAFPQINGQSVELEHDRKCYQFFLREISFVDVRVSSNPQEWVLLKLHIGWPGEIGRPGEGVHLEDVPNWDRWSCRPMRQDHDTYVLPIGAKVPTECLDRIANTIVGCWVVNGIKLDADSGRVQMPYGPQQSSSGGSKRYQRRYRRFLRLGR